MNDSIHGGLRVYQSTPLVQLQDRGRFGCRHLGVTQGGALDWLSMGWANWLLGNPLDAAVIEIALGFSPGFAFMGLVEEALAAPRLATPR
ncbi:carboxyltransferase domain-containing protein, partial [Pseudomonas aeruginosa]|uniref:carboxyltransferase domain-containing protein n=1 Tax=Pseudomonas aeruginosa TaxID=287 RepID=UPI0031B6E9B1